MNGKGDKRRPMKVSSKEYSDNWDLIFKKPANLSFSEQVLNKDSKKVECERVKPKEIGGPKGPEPTRYNDWEKSGRCIDF